MRCGLGLCSQSLAITGGGGGAAGERSSSEGRAADSVVWAAPAPGARLSLRLRGGVGEGSGEEAANQQAQGDEAEYEEEYQGATQACGDSSDDEDEPAVSELRQIEAGGDGKVLQLPDGISFKVLAFGRDEQAAARGDGARVVSVVLPDARPFAEKKISSLQAEISTGEEGVIFKSLGRTFNFVNETPLHATAKKYPTSSRIYHGDVVRFGGGLDGKQNGGLREHVFCVEAPALGVRPAAEAAVPSASPAASSAASSVAAPAAAPAAAAAAPAPAPAPTAAAAAAIEATLRGKGGCADVPLATQRRHKTLLGLAGAPVAQIVATKDYGFDLHVLAGGAAQVARAVFTQGLCSNVRTAIRL